MRINFNLINLKSYNPKKLENKQSFSTSPISFNRGVLEDTFEKNKSVSFLGKYCVTSKFKIKEFENLRCPYCGYLMLTNEQAEAFVSDIYDKKGEDLASALEKYEDDRIFQKETQEKENQEESPKISPKTSIFRPQRQEVVNTIKQLARIYPNLSLYDLIKKEGKAYLEPLIASQMEVVDELEEYINENVTSEEELLHLNKLLRLQEDKINGIGNGEFKRKGFIHDFANTCEDPDIQREIDKIAQKLPNSSNNIESFFVKYSKDGYSSKKIAYALIEPSKITTEHLQSKTDGGGNRTDNYIADCYECNNKRSDKPFFDWQRENPMFQQRMQQYLEQVQKEIDKRNDLDGYDSYADDMVATFKNLSQGEIILVPPRTEDSERRKLILENRKAVLDNLMKKIQEAQKENEEKEKELERTKKQPFFGAIFELLTVQNTISRIQDIIADYSMSEDSSIDLEKIKELEDKIKAQKGREERLKKKVQSYYSFESELEKYRNKLTQYDATSAKVEILKRDLKTKGDLEQEIQMFQTKIKTLEAQNANANVSFEDKKDYETYQHNLELLNEIEQMERDLAKRRKNKSSKNQVEILQIARSSLDFRNETLRQKKGVACLINKHAIEEYRNIIASKEEQLKELEKTQEQILEAQKTLATVLEGKTRKQIEQRIAQLQGQIEMRDNAYNYFKLKASIEDRKNRLANYKSTVVNLLNRYSKVSDREFNERIAKVCI